MIELKENYQKELAYREELLKVWKNREFWRSFFAMMAVICILGIIALGVLSVLIPNFFNSIILIAMIACAVVFIIMLISRHALSKACRRAFDKFWKSDVRSQRHFDQVKREKVDPVLENQIVIGVSSTLYTFATYLYEKKKRKSDGEHDVTYDVGDAKNNPPKLWRAPVSAATAYIDDVEVGAIDVSPDSRFTTFRVTPGLHTLKLKIRRDYADLDKSLEIMTPTLTFTVNGNYHIVSYQLNASLNVRGTLKYSLKTVEYDDMVSYIRDLAYAEEQMEQEVLDQTQAVWEPQNKAELILSMLNQSKGDHNKSELSGKLERRAQVLYCKLYPDVETEAEHRERELKTYGPEVLLMGDVAKDLEKARVDARIKRDNRIEIVATLKREKSEQK